MVVRMARAVVGALWNGQAALVLGLTTALAARAASAEAVVPPPLSALCQAPAGDISTPGPLPHLAAAIESRKPIRVLAVGASVFAVGASASRGAYQPQLKSILEKVFKGRQIVIVNRGVSGEVAATTAARLRTEVALERPDLVLWQAGTNDAIARVPVEDFVDTVKEALDWLHAHQIDIVLVGLQYTPQAARDDYYIAIRDALRNLAAKENVLLVRRFEAMQFIEQARQGDLSPGDDAAFDDQAYRCMAEHIARAVVISTFLKDEPR
jgi:acyl-CoA thioesterase I